jgi:flagellar biosynthetic protein FliR
MRIDLSFLPALAATYMLVFARIGTMIMLLPGLGEIVVSTRFRLTLALVLAAVIFPLHSAAYHVDIRSMASLITVATQELLIGAVLGVSARLAVSALQVTGAVVAQQLGLGFVTSVDPTLGQQGVIISNFLTMLGLVLIFSTDTHYLVIAALNDSYTIFAPGDLPSVGDTAALVSRTVAGSFRIGIQLAAPFLVFGIIFNLGLGVLSRLMPQMQVFFVGVPLSIFIGFLILILVIGAMMTGFIDYLQSVLHEIAPGA